MAKRGIYQGPQVWIRFRGEDGGHRVRLWETDI